MTIHFSSLSSFLQDKCHTWFEERGIKIGLLGSLANDKKVINEVLEGRVKCCKAFIWDSGAVSVRNKKTEITLPKFVEWVKQIPKSEVPVTIVALDVIGDPDASQQNYMKLKYDYGFGNNFLPVFHYGEPYSYLEFLLKEGFDYIGLGGVGAGDRLGQDGLRDWLKEVFFVNSDGKTLRFPGIKFHGFAITSEKTLPLFPFHTVDSATWVKNTAIGKILTPWGHFRVSDDKRAGYDVEHIKRISGETTKKRLYDWVEGLGLTMQEVIEERHARNIVNLNYFKWIEDNHDWKPSMVSEQTVFSLLKKTKDEHSKEKIEDKPKLKISLDEKSRLINWLKSHGYTDKDLVNGTLENLRAEKICVEEYLEKELSKSLDTDISKVAEECRTDMNILGIPSFSYSFEDATFTMISDGFNYSAVSLEHKKAILDFLKSKKLEYKEKINQKETEDFIKSQEEKVPVKLSLIKTETMQAESVKTEELIKPTSLQEEIEILPQRLDVLVAEPTNPTEPKIGISSLSAMACPHCLKTFVVTIKTESNLE